ncbi:MAG: tyrosine-type recombinase/integrase, partial [Usitatibacteraceae bacterium]
GLRAGELSQLLPGDFDFSAEVPHLKVRRVDETGATTKSTKTDGSVRDVPLAPVLLQLGLAEFVAQRAKADRKRRVFHEFNLGSRGRTSDGMTKFWGRYLRAHGLWKPGRATHMWRHTLIANLRENDVSIEDIATYVGHVQQSVTATYGGDYTLKRKLKTALAINYGLDLIAELGGPYNPKKHR